jgi:hypothetical protein
LEPRFVEFEAATGDVRVNVSNVQWTEKGPKDLTGDHTTIMFAPGHALTVKGTVEEVIKKLIGNGLDEKQRGVPSNPRTRPARR